MVENDDWRLGGQEKYLQGLVFTREKYKRPSPEWDHDHCQFCWEKFMEEGFEGTLHEGYVSKEGDRWVCFQCFDDFKEKFQFRLEESNAKPSQPN